MAITDKEVGELWRESRRREPRQGQNVGIIEVYQVHVENLIRKLVEERRMSYSSWYRASSDPTFQARESSLVRACRDFGIDPKEFNG